MTVLSVWYVWVCLGVLVLLHAAAVFLEGMPARIASYANIALHVAYLFLLLLASAPIEEAVLLYMISTLAYSVMCFVKHKLAGGSLGEEGEK